MRGVYTLEQMFGNGVNKCLHYEWILRFVCFRVFTLWVGIACEGVVDGVW